MRILLTYGFLFITLFGYSQKCDVTKVDIEGCLVDEDSFRDLVDRICELEKMTCPTLDTVMMPIYRERYIVAEEASGLTTNSGEWSYGNGSVGFIGEVIDDGWEVCAMFFTADTYPANGTVQVDVMNFGDIASNAAANTISSITLSSSTDGGGQTNNAYKYLTLATPIPIAVNNDATIIGFVTRSFAGTISDARVGVKIRKKVGEFVSDITLVCEDGEGSGDQGLLDNCGNTKPTFFNEQQFAWGFQMLASSSGVSQWQYVIESANYTIDPTQVTNNNEFTYTEIDNGDGTYDLIFTSVAGLAPNASSGSYQINGVNFGFDPESESQSFGCVN